MRASPTTGSERPGREPAHEHDRGQATLLVIAVATIVVVLMVVVARAGEAVVTVEQAQIAADAAALAGVAGGPVAAARLARANGGVLVSIRRLGDDVVVTVEVDGRRASARARRAP